MVTPGPASIVVVEFPFSDLSGAKLRPAVVLTDAGRGDWILSALSYAAKLVEEDVIYPLKASAW